VASTKVRSFSVATAIVALAASMFAAVPAQAAPGYVSNAVFQELAADMAYTNTLLAADSATTSEVGIDTYYQSLVGAHESRNLTNVRFNKYSSVLIGSYQPFDPATQTYTNSANTTQVAGYDDNISKSYMSLSVLSSPTLTKALARMNKPTATYAVTPYNVNMLLNESLRPSTFRADYLGGTTAQGILLSLDYATKDGSPTDIQVNSDFPNPGEKTIAFRVDGPWGKAFTYVVNPDSIVISAQVDEFTKDLSGQWSAFAYSTTMVYFNEFNGTTALNSLLPSDAVTVDFDALIFMMGKISGEESVTPRANAIAIGARVAARKAKGKAKNKVTVAMIQASAKKAGGPYTKIKTGVKLVGVGGENDSRFPGYMCVTAVKNKAVVAHC